MANWLRRHSYKILIFMGLWWLMASSCFQFRSSDTKQLRELKKEDISAELGLKGIEGRQIHYTYYESDTANPLLVFIHGSPGSSSSFLHYIKDTSLNKDYNILLLDRPGFGYSEFGKSEPSMKKQSDYLRKVVASFKRNKVVLVGHSLGGPIICRMAMDDVDLADALLIVAGSISAELEPKESWRKPMDKKLLRWILPTSFRVSNQEIIPAYDELLSMEAYWTKLDMQVTILQGSKDNLVPEGNAHYGEKVMVNATLKKVVIEGENHFIPFDNPEMVVKEILAFDLDS